MPNSFYIHENIFPFECLGDSLYKINNYDRAAADAIGSLETRIVTVSSDLKNQIDLKEDEFTVLPVLSGGTGATTAASARTNLGLGTLATLNSPLLIANGGTGATTAASARTNLGLGTLATLNSIADANVAAGAGILGTKISSNFGSQTITTTGPVVCQYINAQSGTNYFDGDKVRLGREAGVANSGSIAFFNAYDSSYPYIGAFRWNDLYFGAARSGVTVNNSLRVPGVLDAAAITAGNIYAGTGTFTTKPFVIDHPIQKNYKLRHFCIESPITDLLYRGKVTLINGQAIVNIDEACYMTLGTLNAFGTNLTVTSLQNQTGFSRLKPTPIVNGQFTIICEDNTSTDEVSWVVMGERKDLINREIELTLETLQKEV